MTAISPETVKYIDTVNGIINGPKLCIESFKINGIYILCSITHSSHNSTRHTQSATQNLSVSRGSNLRNKQLHQKTIRKKKTGESLFSKPRCNKSVISDTQSAKSQSALPTHASHCSKRLSHEFDLRVAYLTKRLKSESGEGVRHLFLGEEGGVRREVGGGQSWNRICERVPTSRSSTWSLRAAEVSVYLASNVVDRSRASENSTRKGRLVIVSSRIVTSPRPRWVTSGRERVEE